MNSIIGNTRRPDITFYRNGRIDITSYVSRILCLKDGDVIDIGCKDKEFYLFVRCRKDDVIGRHEGRCFASKRGSNNLRLHSRRICDAILTECNATTIAKLAVGEPIEMEDVGLAVPLITRKNLYETGNQI